MQIKDNRLQTLRDYFDEQLAGCYPQDEIRHYYYWCCEAFVGLNKAAVMAHPEQTVSESVLLKYHFAVKDLKKQRPIQYIVGGTDFCGLSLQVREGVLIPRPETEELVQWILAEEHPQSILDLCSGSGCIALALKKHFLQAQVEGIELSPTAVALARENALACGLDVRFREGDILSSEEPLSAKVDVIVSNPPYVRCSEKKDMHDKVLLYEPEMALFVADERPLLFYEKIAERAGSSLHPGGSLYLEINESLGRETLEMLQSKGFSSCRLRQDYRGKDRFIQARWS